jgi:DNA-binding LytR/AlgR family response regulator
MTDIEMPGDMDGLALASTIRERWPETVVLVNSGRVRPEPEALPDRAGFIAKPYRAAELLHQLDVLMEEHGVPILSDGDILEAWHAAELAHAQADALDKPLASDLMRPPMTRGIPMRRSRADRSIGLPATNRLPPGVVSRTRWRAAARHKRKPIAMHLPRE